jgi:hypothetical protein
MNVSFTELCVCLNTKKCTILKNYPEEERLHMKYCAYRCFILLFRFKTARMTSQASGQARKPVVNANDHLHLSQRRSNARGEIC